MSVLSFFKRTKAQINSTAIKDGQLLVTTDTDNLELYVDVNGVTRKKLAMPSAVDNLTSTSATDPLSANQGRVLSASLEAIMSLMTPEMHRVIFRGKNLGNTVTSAQKAAITDGSFNDLFVGDYWIINGITWRIVDINYWLNCGDTAFTTNHLVIMPDNPLYNATMNATNITAGGYIGSLMYTANLDSAKTTVNTAFGTLVKMHKQMFTNAVTNGKPSGGIWVNSSIDLPNEINMYGSHIFSPGNDGITSSYRYTIDRQQFSAFAIKPSLVVTRQWHQWLRDVVSATNFTFVGNDGLAHSISAASSCGVRPCFAIG